MNRTIAIALVVAALAGTIILPTGSTGAAGGAAVPMKIIVDGLQANDVAVLRLGVDDGSLKLTGPPLYEYAVNASSSAAQEIEINPEPGRRALSPGRRCPGDSISGSLEAICSTFTGPRS